jgi:regulator of protease activity HflC (stomatin/prohibitin superfamily)
MYINLKWGLVSLVEQKVWKVNGFLSLVLLLALIGSAFFLIINDGFILGGFLVFAAIILSTGFTLVQPNEAKAVLFFGRYMGTIRENGIWYTIPFSAAKKVSLKVRNFNSETLTVNDVEGNPIEIAAVVVFKVVDSARALFDVDDYSAFVTIQSETALRHVASKYPYDNFTDQGYSLRGNTEEIADELAQELQARLAVAGVEVMETRLTHLKYATEIASAMLQRQQASAILAARQIVVEGAVGMAQMAIDKLTENGTVELDEERKVAMINNLLVAIVSDRSAQPVINTGTLYS